MKLTSKPENDNASGQAGEVGRAKYNRQGNRNPPMVTGQCAEVLGLTRKHPQIVSLAMTADRAIPEAAARVHDLRATGFNILATLLPRVEFRGEVRRNVALYSLGTPEWPAPGFTEGSAP